MAGWIKTEEHIDGLSANRAREFVEVLNKKNLITEKREYVPRGKWSHDRVVFYGKPPLYVIRYYHSTHPGPGTLYVHRYDESEKAETIYYVSGDMDVAPHIPEELEPYKETIKAWLKRYMPRLVERSVLLDEYWANEFSDELEELVLKHELRQLLDRHKISAFGLFRIIRGESTRPHAEEVKREFRALAEKYGRERILAIVRRWA